MNAEFKIGGTIIETERLILRAFQQTDLQDFYEYAKVDGVGQMAGWLPHKNLDESRVVDTALRVASSSNAYLAAICAAPIALEAAGVLTGRKVTCYPADAVTNDIKSATLCDAPAVTDGNIITGRGPGWAVEFGLAILSHIKGQEIADKVKAGLML